MSETSYREQGRAVFLAAMMVLSVVAMSAAFAGATAAQEEGIDVTVTVDEDEPNVGDEIEIVADIENSNDEDVIEDFDLTVDGESIVEVGDINIPANSDNQSIDETYEIAADQEGDDLAVVATFGDASDETTVSVQEQESGPDPASGINYDHDGSVVWQGQDVVAYGELVHDNHDVGDDVQLRMVDSFSDDENTFEEELSTVLAEDIGAHTHPDIHADEVVVAIDTDDLESEYYLIDSDSIGLSSSFSSSDAFEVSVQDLDVDFDDTSVTDSGPDAETEVEFDSRRGSYHVNASADGDLDAEELFAIFTTDGADAPGFDQDTIGEVIAEDDDIGDREDFAAAVYDAGNYIDLDEDADDYDGPTYGDFGVALYHEDADGDDLDGDEKVALLIGGDVEGDVSFDGIDDDEYTFDFNVTDTEASDSVDVEVAESDATADFDQSVYSQTAGDIIHVNVDLEDTDDAYLQFGDEDSGYVDFIYIEDDDDNGEVDLTLNTRLMGTGHPYAVVSSDDEVVSLVDHADEDARDTDSANVGGAFSGLVLYEDEVDESETISFNEYLDELDLADDEEGAAYEQLVRPLQATDYPLRSSDGHFVADDGEADVDNELDAATVDLTTPSVEEITTLVAPEDSADEHELAELLADDDEEATMTPRTDIAEDDRLIVRAEASGIFGAMIALEEDEYDPLEDGFEPETVHELNQLDGEGVTIEIEGDDRVGNQDPNFVDFENADEDDVIVFANNADGELYIVVDTSSSDAFDRSYEDGDSFEAVIEYETDDDDRFYFDGAGWIGGAGDSAGDGDTDEPAFPYFAADSDESVSTEFDMVERDIWFDNLDEDDNVQLETSSEAAVTGETNVAPGSEADLRITNAGETESFLHTVDATINSDGDFESEDVDFSERDEGDEAELDFRVFGSSVDDADGIFVEELADDDDAPADDGADDTADDDGTDDDAPVDDGTDDDAPVDDGTDDDAPVDDDEDGVPGFGLAIAVVALLAAAMLALRRQ